MMLVFCRAVSFRSWPEIFAPRISISISVPIFACADETYAMPMPQFKLGESVPLVTSPIRSPLRNTA